MANNEKEAYDVKNELEEAENITPETTNADYVESGIDLEYEKKLMRKIDWRLLPILGVLYSAALIDRSNVSSAGVAGMKSDLKLGVGDRNSIVLLIFFVPYFIFELPSNILLRKVGAAKWLGTIALLWGVVMISMGFVNDWRVLVVCRAILGFFESGFFPGCVYLISSWYVRYEVQKRMAGFYLVSVLVGGFSSILAYYIMKMEGVQGLRSWRWIFIIEGALTCGGAILAYFLITDFPDKLLERRRKQFLSADDVALVKARIDRDRDDSQADDLTMEKVLKHLSDWKLWVYAMMYMCSTAPSYAFPYFMPYLLQSMGYDAKTVQLLSAPPYVSAVAIAFSFAWASDRTRLRGPFIIAGSVLIIMGLSMTAYHPSNSIRYLGIFIGLAGAQANVPTILTYQANNIRTNSKRSVGSALQIGFGAIGGIYASTVFREEDYPRYVNGLWATIGTQFLLFILVGIMSVYFTKKNRQHAEGTLSEPLEGHENFTYAL